MAELLTLRCDCDRAVEGAIRLLGECGLNSSPSFDLRSTSYTPLGCSCPHHGQDPCACNLVIVLVYGAAGPPATLIFHGHNGQTWIALDTTPGQRPVVDLENLIKRTVTAGALAYLRVEPGDTIARVL